MDRFRRFVLFLVGFALPMEHVNFFSIAGVPITPTKLVTLLLLVLAAMQWAVEGRWIRPDRKNGWVAAFFVSYGVGIVMSVALGIHVRVLTWHITTGIALCLYYYLIPYSVKDRRDLDVLLGSIGAGCIVTVTTALAGVGFAEETEAGLRAGGLGGEVNVAGFNLTLVLPMMFLFFFVARSRMRRLAALGVAVLAVVGIIVGLSRSAFVATVAMVGLWVARFRRIDTLVYIIPIVLLLGVAVLFAPEEFKSRVESFTTEEGRAADPSIQKRFMVNEWGVRALLSNPIVGVGVGRFGVWAMARNPLIGYGHSIHNAYLQVAAGQGLLGLIPYLVILTYTWRDFTRCWRAGRRPPFHRDPELSRLGLTAVFLQISLLGALVGYTFMPSVRWKMGWLVIATSNVVVRLTRERLQELETRSPASVSPLGAPLSP